jgi:plastocyanin
MSRGFRVLALAAVSLAAWLGPVPSVGAQGAPGLEVQVGAPLFSMPEARHAPADGMRFYAPPLEVHSGDTITFTFAGFHTATLLPANTDVDTWVRDNTGPGGQYSLIVPDPDDGGTADQPAMKGNNLVAFPSVGGSPATCGAADGPCEAGSSVVNSGLPFRRKSSFSVTVTGAVGDRIPVICLVHVAMRMNVEIVDAGAGTTTQNEIDRYLAETTARDARRASRLDHALSATHDSHRENGGIVWDAWAGVDARGFSLLGMYPARIDVRKGQRVQWHFDELIYEDHTVSLPITRASRFIAQTFTPLCDTDGDASGRRMKPDLPPPDLCSKGVVEFAVPAQVAWPRGNGTFEGTGYENSGIRGSNTGETADYTLRFTDRSGARGFRYVCELHPFMRATVVVR